MSKISIFLDSGAFSSFTKNIEIKIEDYILFIKEHIDLIDNYSVLDVINDAETTLKNQLIMEQHGLNPTPCFHYSDDLKYLTMYTSKYERISIGGMVPISTGDLLPWLDNIFQNYICDKNGFPKVKVHGFGITVMELMFKYPWYSVDSSSWALTGAFGSIYLPKLKNGVFDYTLIPVKIKISDRAPQDISEGVHFQTMSPAEQKYVIDYVESKGYKLGKSSYKKVDKKYKLAKNERWVIKNEEVEVREECGLTNDHNQRDRWNIQYFVELEKYFTPWPWPFKPNKLEGFGL